MPIDDTPLTERTFTETHDRILHALVEQVHDMGVRLAALEAAELSSQRDAMGRADHGDATIAPPALPTDATAPAPSTSHRVSRASTDAPSRPMDQPNTKTRSGRVTGWQPARR